MFTIEPKWGRINMDDPQCVGQCQTVSVLCTCALCGSSNTARETFGSSAL